jgi:hypothetical protein
VVAVVVTVVATYGNFRFRAVADPAVVVLAAVAVADAARRLGDGGNPIGGTGPSGDSRLRSPPP